MSSSPQEPDVEEILDAHAEYYIKQTMKFFQENGESPALSKNNEGDLKAKQALNQLILKARIDELAKASAFYHKSVGMEFSDYVSTTRPAQLNSNLKRTSGGGDE